MKNKLSDLNNHLFAQLERLSEEDLTPEQIETEAKRAQSIVQISDQIIGNANMQYKAAELVAKHGDRYIKMMPEAITAPKTVEHEKVAPATLTKPLTEEELERKEANERRERRERAEMREDMRNGEAA